MVLPRKCRSVNNRCYSIPKLSLTKDGDGAQRSNSRRRKLADKLGPKWTVKELTRYYDSYYKNGKDWEKVCPNVHWIRLTEICIVDCLNSFPKFTFLRNPIRKDKFYHHNLVINNKTTKKHRFGLQSTGCGCCKKSIFGNGGGPLHNEQGVFISSTHSYVCSCVDFYDG